MTPNDPAPEGSIVITPAEVYGEVRALTEVVRELVAQDKAEKDQRAEEKRRVDDIDTRVKALEQKVWLVTGAAATLGGSIGAIAPSLLR